MNASTPHSGRLELQLGGVWSTVYGSELYDAEAASKVARVACRTLGLKGGNPWYEKRGLGAKGHYLDANCEGREATLAQCVWGKLSSPADGSRAVYNLGVVCTGGQGVEERGWDGFRGGEGEGGGPEAGVFR